MNWDEITPELEKKLNPDHVKKGGGNFGPKGDYIEGWHAITEANRIFGFGNWSYEIKGLTQTALAEGTDSKGNPQWQAAYICTIRTTVGGAVREDVGFGSGFAKHVGDAVEGATKEAVTDALKRTLRTFGNPFGLALYDKTKANVGKPEPTSADLSARFLKSIAGVTSIPKLEAGMADPSSQKRLAAMTPEDRAHVEAAIEAKKAELGELVDA